MPIGVIMRMLPVGKPWAFFMQRKEESRVANRKNKRIYTTDIWEQWKKDGKLEEVLAFIADCSKKLFTQREMCKYLKI